MSHSAANSSIAIGRRLFLSCYRNRRRLATGSAVVLALLLGYYAVAGSNGLTIYKQKRIEDRHLAGQIEDLKAENARLLAHVGRLRTDPEAIEHEAREKLHYARPGEVIYTLRDPPARGQAAAPKAPEPQPGR